MFLHDERFLFRWRIGGTRGAPGWIPSACFAPSGTLRSVTACFLVRFHMESDLIVFLRFGPSPLIDLDDDGLG